MTTFPKSSPPPWASSLSISSGIDFLTCSQPLSGGHSGLFDAAACAQRSEEQRGCFRKKWASHGMVGWVVGSIVAARSPTHAMCSIAGPLANEYFRVLWPHVANVSRIDLQETYTFAPGRARGFAQALYRTRDRDGAPGRPSARQIRLQSDGGATVYFGSRQSEWYGRAYDKGIEEQTDPPGTRIRLEVEIKGDAARSVAAAEAAAASIELQAAQLVQARFTAWGVRGLRYRSPSLIPQTLHDRSDVDQTLEWLRVAVGPSVSRLCRLGLEPEVRSVLNLPGPPTWIAQRAVGPADTGGTP